MKAATLAALSAARSERRSVALVTRLADGAQALVDAAGVAGDLALEEATVAAVRAQLGRAESGVLEGDAGLFVRCYVPALRLAIIGAVHVGQALKAVGEVAGYAVTVIDPRTAFATSQHFRPGEVIGDWPDEALRRLAPDTGTAIVTLTHDPKLDDPALIIALRSPAFYVGALGSRRTHAQRVTRLQEAGLGPELRRLHAPVGLDLGGRSAGEIAVAIMAQIIQVRYRPAPLS